MNLRQFIIFSILTSVLAFGCAKRVTIEIPPQVDLQSYDAVGIVEFTSDAKGELPSLATQRFIEALQRSQPGVRVLELGNEEELKEAIGCNKLDYSAMNAIREQFGVEAVILGKLDVTDVRPNINLQDMMSALSASAEVDASLTARLLEAPLGVTVWTMSSRRTKKVAHVGMSGGVVVFDAQDPDRAYGTLVEALVHDITRDFRVTYATR